jgi:hypothetical protein
MFQRICVCEYMSIYACKYAYEMILNVDDIDEYDNEIGEGGGGVRFIRYVYIYVSICISIYVCVSGYVYV